MARPIIRSPEQVKQRRAYGAMHAAMKAGLIKSNQPCANCPHPWAVPHHYSYDRPLDLHWVCVSCHRKVHFEMKILADAGIGAFR